ncbi:MAG TPA: hypothetical protein VIJ18_10495 [Microbacteriaceae bacterium]
MSETSLLSVCCRAASRESRAAFGDRRADAWDGIRMLPLSFAFPAHARRFRTSWESGWTPHPDAMLRGTILLSAA